MTYAVGLDCVIEIESVLEDGERPLAGPFRRHDGARFGMRPDVVDGATKVLFKSVTDMRCSS